MFTRLRLKIRDFFKRNRSKILIFLIAWLIVIIINSALKNYKAPEVLKTSYSPHTSVMDNTSKVPEKYQSEIESLINEYITCCNNKDYEKAYNMLSEECKSEIYPEIDEFKKYVDGIFNEKKIYSIQNYSNVDNTYVYLVNIFDDILATGMTGQEDLQMYQEKFVIQNDNGKLNFAIREYIGKEENYQVYEDQYIKVEIQEVTQSYENQVYKLKLTNRCEYTIVLADGSSKKEIMLELTNQRRNIENLPARGAISLLPYESKELEFKFVKFFDENDDVTGMVFNAVRVLKSYSGLESKRQEELDNAIKLYSFVMKL